jgi:hypothetical protein
MNKKATELKIEAIEKETRGFCCPVCNTNLQFMASIVIKSVKEAPSPLEIDIRDGRESIKKVDIEILEQASKLGVLDAFKTACELSDKGAQTNNFEKYFLTFLEKAQRLDYPQYGLRMALPRDGGGGELSVYSLNNIACILSDGYFKSFMPLNLLKGEALKPLVKSARIKSETINLDTWVKTRFGYVATKGLMLDELRKRSKGAFQV